MKLTSLTRNAIFKKSVFVDNLIAEMQQSYARDLDVTDTGDAAILKSRFDHQIPFNTLPCSIDSSCILAYATHTKRDYLIHFPRLLKLFLSHLNIDQLYLMDFLNIDFKNFPFENYSKRNHFLRLVNKNVTIKNGFKFEVKDIEVLLPLFFFSRKWDIPIVFLLTAENGIPISLRLCDDGNLHLNFYKENQKLIEQAAGVAGLTIGDLDLCSTCSICYL